MSQFIAFTLTGLVTGSIYAIAASGLVVTYVTSGIFNIGHGAVGMLMAFLYWQVRVHMHWPAPIALIVVIFIAAPLVGAVIERLLMRGLRNASVATSLVITVGLMVGMIGLAQQLWSPGEARNLPGFFDPHGFKLGGVFLAWHQVITILTGAGVAIFLWLFLTRSRTGTAMRAVVDDRNLASLTGARPTRISQLSWAMGSSLAAVAGILLAPVLQLNVLVLTLLVVNAYAAAMFGRLQSLPLTFVGALVLGLVEAYTVGYINLQGSLIGLRQALPTIFLFILLLLMPEARLRAGRLVGAATPPVSTAKRSLIGAVALVAVAVVVSRILGIGDLVRVGQGLAFAIIMASLVLLTGYAGQVSLCVMTFAGLGAFSMAKLGHGGNPLGLIIALAFAGIIGALVALPALRLQGLYLALATMAFAVLMDNLFFPNQHVFGSLGTLRVARLHLPGLSFEGERTYFVLLAVMFGLVGILIQAIRRGPFGRLLAAMRDSPVACATLGVSLTRTKLAVFMLSASLAGLGGVMFAGLRGNAGPTDFLMFQSLPVLLLAVVGGITTVTGSLIGGITFSLLIALPSRFAGLLYLIVGGAAVSLGRNPNGLAFIPMMRFRRAKSPTAPPAIRVEQPALQEAAGVAAPTA
jgi:branched-chain amino acid transport system permease protein